ncbi:MAG: xylulokinase [Gammaproteobacteria bacterium]|nr:xylulokinase [Gammaproteobacteria bacterium]
MYLGIDLGTSGVKLVLIDDQQKTIGQVSQPLTVSQPHLLWSEQNPADWWQATSRAMEKLQAQFPESYANIQAIGLSGQQHGATLLDAAGEVLRPAILWNDGRAFSECEIFSTQIPEYETLIGSRMMPGFTAPKILWVKNNEPDIFNRIAKVLLPKDYLRFKMTGQYATDMSDASGTGWLDIQNRQWSEAMLSVTHLSLNHMPELFEGNEVTSTLDKKIATEWKLSPDTKIIAGGGDNPAAAMSMHVIEQGAAFLSLGTSGVYFVASDSYKTNSFGGVHSFCHALPNRWHHMTVHLSAASCLSWFANMMQCTESELLAEAEQASQNQHIIFLPYLSGERSPHNNPHARGIFFGLSHTTTRAEMTQAILEGVAFAFLDGQTAMLEAGIEINTVYVVGGGAKSLYWGRILASVLNRPLTYSQNREVGAAVGAARLAWLACHPEQSAQDVNSTIEAIISPNAEQVEKYQTKYQKFRELYQRLSSFFSNEAFL